MESARLRCIIAIFAAIAAMTLYPDVSMCQVDLTTGLVSYWSFDIDAGDDSGNGHSGSLVGATHHAAGGKIGGCFSFDGDDYITTTTLGDWGSQMTRHTISLWMRWTDSSVMYPLGSAKTSHVNVWVSLNGNVAGRIHYYFQDRIQSPGSVFTPAGGYNDGVWHHVVGVYDFSQNNATLFVDGEPVHSITCIASDFANLQYPFVIGAWNRNGIPSGHFIGAIDEIGIWNRSLTSSEIENLYNDGNGLPYPFTAISNQAPSITSTPAATAGEGSGYVYDVDADDPDGDVLTYSLVTSPAGMNIASDTGVITWTPGYDQYETSPEVNVTVEVNDGMGGTDTQSFIITVENTDAPPVISPIPDITFDCDSSYFLSLNDYVDDPDNPDSELDCAVGDDDYVSVSIDPSTHVVEFTSKNANWGGSTVITITMTDPLGLSDQADVNVTVIDSVPPQLSNVASEPYALNDAFVDVVISWDSDEPTTSQVEYGQTAGYGSLTPIDSNLVMSHQVVIPDLAHFAEYHYRVRSLDSSGSESISGDYTISTIGPHTVTVDTDQDVYTPGTPVNISVQVQQENSEPVANWPAAISVEVHGFTRRWAVDTDENGTGIHTFTPSIGDAGAYNLTASVERYGLVREAQDVFSVLGMQVMPNWLFVDMGAGTSETRTISIKNIGDETITGINVSADTSSLPNGLSVVIDDSSTTASLGSGQSTTFDATVSALVGVDAYTTFDIVVGTAHSYSESAKFNVKVKPTLPIATVSPSSFNVGVHPGETVQQTVVVSNTGYGSLSVTDVEVNLPNIDTQVIIGDLEDLEHNQSGSIQIIFGPALDVSLATYAGNVILDITTGQVDVPFEVAVSQDQTASVRFIVSNDFGELIPEANIALTPRFPEGTMKGGETGQDGILKITNLPVGRYICEVNAERHDGQQRIIEVYPAVGTTQEVEIILLTNALSYEWEVVPTTIPDTYAVKLNYTFHTDIPKPILFTAPPWINLAFSSSGDVVEGKLNICNGGLIDIRNLRITGPAEGTNLQITTSLDPTGHINVSGITIGSEDLQTIYYRAQIYEEPEGYYSRHPNNEISLLVEGNYIHFDPLTGEPIKGIASVEVPIRIGYSGDGHIGGGYSGGGYLYSSNSGVEMVPEVIPCPLILAEIETGVYVYLGGASLEEYRDLHSEQGNAPATDVTILIRNRHDLPVAVANYFIGLSYNLTGLYQWIGQTRDRFTDAVGMLDLDETDVSEVAKLIKGAITEYEDYVRNYGSIWYGDIEDMPSNGGNGFVTLDGYNSIYDNQAIMHAERIRGAGENGEVSGEKTNFVDYAFNFQEGIDIEAGVIMFSYNYSVYSIPYSSELENELNKGNLNSFPNGTFPSEAVVERANDINEIYGMWWVRDGGQVTQRILKQDQDQNPGVYNLNVYAEKEYNDVFILPVSIISWPKSGCTLLADLLFGGGLPGFSLGGGAGDWASGWDRVEQLDGVGGEEELIHEIVRFQVDQMVVLERQGFKASLKMVNMLLTTDITDIGVTVNIYDENSNDASSSFAIGVTDLSGINDVAGQGVLGPGILSETIWTLIPDSESGGTSSFGRQYHINATISYSINGQEYTAETSTETVTVFPQPQLRLDYFLPQEVTANDPFRLGVVATNMGSGPLTEFSVESMQPRIVENLSGLLMNMSIIGTSVNGDERTTLVFDEIAAGQSVIGYWTIVSSMDGKITEFDAEWSHSDYQGIAMDPLISEIHTHLIAHDWILTEIGDRLALIDEDNNGLPDYLMSLENAGKLNVSQVAVEVTHPATANECYTDIVVSKPESEWIYVSVIDPFPERSIQKIIRKSDLTELFSDNYWRGDIDIHFVDDPDTEYTIIYESEPELVETNVTSMVEVEKAHARFDRRTGQLSLDLTVINTSDKTLYAPVKLIVQNINPSTGIEVVNKDGMDNGDPYFDFSTLVGDDGKLSTGEISASKHIIFSNPQRKRFTFDLVVMASLPADGQGAPSQGEDSNSVITIIIPGESALLQNYPNPFNPDTWIPYELAEPADVIIKIYDVSGRLVRTLDLGYKELDIYTSKEKAAYWDGRNEVGESVASGVYFYQIKAGDFVSTKKFVMLK